MPDSDPNKPSQAGKLKAAEFSPLETPGKSKKFSVSPGILILGFLSVVAGFILIFLFIARAVIFHPDPEISEIEVSGLSFNIGNNYLLLRGDRKVSADAPGYYHFEESIPVSGERSQEIDIKLEPLPGRVDISSDLDEIAVSIDGEPVGLAPGVIEDVSKGTHIIEFSKRRYFTDKQELEVEGLGRTQSMTVSLDPAWGHMQFSSVPEGADLSIDGELVGQTPLRTEVLETGSRLSITARGYKTYEKDIFIKAGTEEDYPPVTLIVADGTLNISSTPRGASVTVGGEFRGLTPISVPLSPLSSHRLELFLEGYQKTVRTARVEPEKTSSLAVSLTPIIGRIEMSVSPGDSEILVDGNVQGSGNRVLSLTAREHEIIVRKPGYASQSFRVTPRPEHAQSLDVSLLTVEQDYWSTRPPQINSPLGARLKLFRPDSSFKLGAPRREPGRRANEAERNVKLVRPFYIGTLRVPCGASRWTWIISRQSTCHGRRRLFSVTG
jgi:hypothetical protein